MPLDVEILIEPQTGIARDGRQGTIDPETGGLWVDADDGGMDLIQGWRPHQKRRSKDHFENLVDVLDLNEVSRVGDEVWRGVQADIQSRALYLETIAEAIKLLGLRIEPQRSDAGGSGAPLEGMSTVRHPLLLEAVIRFQSDGRGELLPAGGPVKVRNDAETQPDQIDAGVANAVIDWLMVHGMMSPAGAASAKTQLMAAAQAGNPLNAPSETTDDLAEALERDFNHFLTSTASEYYPDTDRALFSTGLVGCTFKKIYNCPLRERPVSESVDAMHLIVDAGVTDLANAPRVTHEQELLDFEIRQLIEAGVYAEMPIGTPVGTQDAVDQAQADALGYDAFARRPEDRPHTMYECYCRLNLRGLDDGRKKDSPYRVPLPYKVTIDRDSRTVYEIRRNWAAQDAKKRPRKIFVKYPYIPALGFYDVGLMHILGNTTIALTAAWRLMLDSMMFANFPGFLYADIAGKQLTNIFRIPPGGGQPIQVPPGMNLGQMVMPMPYKGPDAAGLQLIESISGVGQRVGGTAELSIGEGQQNAPVGTTLALIEQATKPTAAVFKRLHGAQAEEFALLRDRFREDPEAFWRHNEKPARMWERQEFLSALDNYDLVPSADPNTPSQMHRVMKSAAVFQMALQAPLLFRKLETAERLLKDIGVSGAKDLLVSQQELDAAMAAQQTQPAGGKASDPLMGQAAMLRAQAAQSSAQAQIQKAQISATEQQSEAQLRAHNVMVESADRAADRQAKTAIDTMRAQTEQAKQAAVMQKLRYDQAHAAQQQQQDHFHATAEHGLALNQMNVDHAQAANQHALGVAKLQHDQQVHTDTHSLGVASLAQSADAADADREAQAEQAKQSIGVAKIAAKAKAKPKPSKKGS